MPDRPAIANRAWTLLFELLAAEKHRLVTLAESFGLTPTEMLLLKRVGCGDTVAMQDLATIHDKSTITRVVNRLVKLGYMVRRENPEDRRSKLVCLTDSGCALHEKIASIFATAPPSIARLPTADLEDLVRILTVARQTNRDA